MQTTSVTQTHVKVNTGTEPAQPGSDGSRDGGPTYL